MAWWGNDMTCICERLLLTIEKIKEEVEIIDKASDQLFKKGNHEAWKIGQAHILAYTNVLMMLYRLHNLNGKPLTFLEKIKLIFKKTK